MLDGRQKVTGAAQYTDDLKRPRMLHGAFLRSPHAHARIRAIDASAALAMEGVHLVLTGDDLPTFRIQPHYIKCFGMAAYVEAAALPDRKVDDTVVFAQHITIEVDDLARQVR